MEEGRGVRERGEGSAVMVASCTRGMQQDPLRPVWACRAQRACCPRGRLSLLPRGTVPVPVPKGGCLCARGGLSLSPRGTVRCAPKGCGPAPQLAPPHMCSELAAMKAPLCIDTVLLCNTTRRGRAWGKEVRGVGEKCAAGLVKVPHAVTPLHEGSCPRAPSVRARVRSCGGRVPVSPLVVLGSCAHRGGTKSPAGTAQRTCACMWGHQSGVTDCVHLPTKSAPQNPVLFICVRAVTSPGRGPDTHGTSIP